MKTRPFDFSTCGPPRQVFTRQGYGWLQRWVIPKLRGVPETKWQRLSRLVLQGLFNIQAVDVADLRDGVADTRSEIEHETPVELPGQGNVLISKVPTQGRWVDKDPADLNVWVEGRHPTPQEIPDSAIYEVRTDENGVACSCRHSVNTHSEATGQSDACTHWALDVAAELLRPLAPVVCDPAFSFMDALDDFVAQGLLPDVVLRGIVHLPRPRQAQILALLEVMHPQLAAVAVVAV